MTTFALRPSSMLLASALLLCVGCGGGGGGAGPAKGSGSTKPPEQKAVVKKDLPPRQVFEKSGGFSIDPPPGWEVLKIPGQKYQTPRGPAANGFRPNMSVSDEEFRGTLQEYVSESKRALRESGKLGSVTFLKDQNFETADGLKFIRLTVLAKAQGLDLRMLMNVTSNGTHRYVVTFGCLAQDGEKWDDIFLASMKTFRLH